MLAGEARTSLVGLLLAVLVGLIGLLLAVVALAGCGVGAPSTAVSRKTPPAAAATITPVTTARSVAPSTDSDDEGPQLLPSAAAVGVASVSIPAIGLRAQHLERLALQDDGMLAAPRNPDRAGWYAAGTVPGDVGPAVIAGHVDSTTGPAVFFRLGQLRRADSIVVTLTTGTQTRFSVDRVIHAAKDDFPTDAVYGPIPDAQLRLITCSGTYDRSRGGYLDNTIVFATAD